MFVILIISAQAIEELLLQSKLHNRYISIEGLYIFAYILWMLDNENTGIF